MKFKGKTKEEILNEFMNEHKISSIEWKVFNSLYEKSHWRSKWHNIIKWFFSFLDSKHLFLIWSILLFIISLSVFVMLVGYGMDYSPHTHDPENIFPLIYKTDITVIKKLINLMAGVVSFFGSFFIFIVQFVKIVQKCF